MKQGGGKPLVWLHGEVRTPPLTAAARVVAGELLRRQQRGEVLNLPHSRPMPALGRRCHELRVVDERAMWRIVYRVDADAIVVAEVFSKKTQATPRSVLDACRHRLRVCDAISPEEE
jgi:phage-related protein